MKNLLLVFSIIAFLFSDVNATWQEKFRSLFHLSKTKSTESMNLISVKDIEKNKKKQLDKEQSSENIPYFRVLVRCVPLLAITKFPTENRISIERFSFVSNDFVVDALVNSLVIQTGSIFYGVTLQTSLVLYPELNNSMFKTNIWYSFGRLSCKQQASTMSREYFNARYLTAHKKR